MDRAQFLIASQILIDGLQHGLLVFVRKGESGERQGILEHSLRDARRAFLLRLRPQHFGEHGRSQPHSG